MKGVYLLILQLSAELRALPVGRLGCFDFAAGFYLYVGSALGSGGIPARLARHERGPQGQPHWHIDYLRTHTALLETWAMATADPRMEACLANGLAATAGLSLPAPGFGATDSSAASHLFYAPTMPARVLLLETLLHCAEQIDVREFTLDIRDYRAR